MRFTKRLSPPNSVVLVMDRASGEPPRSMGAGAVAATTSCVAIGTLCEVDGQTSVTITDEAVEQEAARDLRQVFDGVLATPSREMHVCTVSLESVGSLPVPATQARVQVWTNHSTAPDRVLVVVG